MLSSKTYDALLIDTPVNQMAVDLKIRLRRLINITNAVNIIPDDNPDWMANTNLLFEVLGCAKNFWNDYSEIWGCNKELIQIHESLLF